MINGVLGVHAGTRRVPSSDFLKQRVPSVRCVFTIGPLVGIGRRVPSKVFSNTPLGVINSRPRCHFVMGW